METENTLPKSTDSVITPIDNTPVPATPRTIATMCLLCESNLEHTDVVLLGLSSDDKSIAVHPKCLTPGKNDNIKTLDQVHVHVEKDKKVSPAKALIIKKRIKEIFKAIAIANERKKLEQQAS